MRILGTIAFYAICIYAFTKAAPTLARQLLDGLMVVLTTLGA